ncbi:ATPase domain-containing protein [Methylobacterium soli]|uniref:non-specific serine/threonine protein kinase n=1 Tax=Methylobacterium soli TaxID=553447 RepID=A0A6L3SNF9_9HYPH|nr:ATPase domain-containing protein [Methylobacterium soli]KAB1068763.1 AAA family ATPase [Methylobacterium soli]GJE41501.1 Circadian clock protein kinase KaiC [Methylobacterium soli]
MARTLETPDKAAFGIVGLDDILGGGLVRDRFYLLEGDPGTGKTTIALQFLLDGAAQDEKTLYITLSETEEELREVTTSHGWDFDPRIAVFEVIPPESLLDADQQQSLLYSADLELGETVQQILDAVDRVKPTRIVLDSLSEIRLLAGSSLRYRRQILAFKHHFARHATTVLMLDDLTAEALDKTVHSVAHGVIRLEELAPDYGAQRRRLRVIKYRGQHFRGGFHDYTIVPGGVRVFPRLVSLEHRTGFTREQLVSGIAELDALLGGGIETGSSAMILGPSGTGKTLFAIQYVLAAAARGERAAMFIFDEEIGLLLERTRQMGYDLEGLRDAGKLLIEQVDAAELTPGEFAHKVRSLVAEHAVKTVVIDSLNGYRAAMPNEHVLVLHIHELMQYLNRQGATTFLTVAEHGLVGDMATPAEVTHLADTVILLRYFEAFGRMRRAISIVKKRAGWHEDTIREYRITSDGLRIGDPLEEFQGVLSGVPAFTGKSSDLA